MKVLNHIRRECDVIIRLADARNPKTLFSFKTRKRTIVVFNKIDLCSTAELCKLKKKYKNAIFVSTRTRKGKGQLLHKLIEIANREKRLIRVGVVGYPNVGKSSLINMIRGKRSARVSATPGETKGVQWLKIKDNILMYDTPGVLTHGMSERSLAKLFAITPENMKDPEGTAEHFIKMLVKKKGIDKLRAKYGIECSENDAPQQILEKIAERHKMLLKENELDLDRAAKKVIRDWQRGI